MPRILSCKALRHLLKAVNLHVAKLLDLNAFHQKTIMSGIKELEATIVNEGIKAMQAVNFKLHLDVDLIKTFLWNRKIVPA